MIFAAKPLERLRPRWRSRTAASGRSSTPASSAAPGTRTGAPSADRLHALGALPGRRARDRCSSTRCATGVALPEAFVEARDRPADPLDAAARARSTTNRDRWVAGGPRSSCADDRPRGHGRASRSSFLAVFFAWPLAAILERSLVVDGALDVPLDVLTRRSTLEVAWFTLWQATVSTALTLVAGAAARVGARRASRSAAGRSSRRSCSCRSSCRRSSSRRRSSRCCPTGSSGPCGRSSSRTSSSTSPSWCGSSARSGRGSTGDSGTRPRRSAPGPVARASRVTLPLLAPGARVARRRSCSSSASRRSA